MHVLDTHWRVFLCSTPERICENSCRRRPWEVSDMLWRVNGTTMEEVDRRMRTCALSRSRVRQSTVIRESSTYLME